MPAPALSRIYVSLLVLGLLLALAGQTLAARRHAREAGLLRLETRLLEQEIRLLSQQLEAERILATADARPPAPTP